MTRGTKHHAIRANDDLWLQVKAKAEAEGANVSEITRKLWREWLNADADEK